MAWAMATRWRCPPESLSPRSPDHRFVAVGEGAHELLDVGGPPHLMDEVHVGAIEAGHAVADVLGDAPVQHLGVLWDIGDVIAQRSLGDGGDVLAVEQDGAPLDVHEPQDELGQGRLARARGADQTHMLAGLDAHVEPENSGASDR